MALDRAAATQGGGNCVAPILSVSGLAVEKIEVERELSVVEHTRIPTRGGRGGARGAEKTKKTRGISGKGSKKGARETKRGKRE